MLQPSLRIDTLPGDATGSEVTRGIARRGDDVRAFTRWQPFFPSSPFFSLFRNRKRFEGGKNTEPKYQVTSYEQRTTVFY